MSGIRISARRTDPLRRKVASIQRRLRVRILPVDSKVESSNMACLPVGISRAAREAEFQAQAGWPLATLFRARGAEPEALRTSREEPLCLCRHRGAENCSRGMSCGAEKIMGRGVHGLRYTPVHRPGTRRSTP